MAFKMGFAADNEASTERKEEAQGYEPVVQEPRRSIVQVHFDDRGMTLSYYNDLFDLKRGDIVYVDGKLEGLRGRVVSVNYNFKIKLSDYQKVIAVADTSVRGTLYMACSHFVSFDRGVIPREKIARWFLPPVKPEDEYVSGNDGTAFALHHPEDMKMRWETVERGRLYYQDNKIKYLCLDNGKGYAIVEGSRVYEVEFEYDACEDIITKLTCSCYCDSHCKHEFAVMLQMQETLHWINEHYSEEYEKSRYFAALGDEVLVCYVLRKERGKVVMFGEGMTLLGK